MNIRYIFLGLVPGLVLGFVLTRLFFSGNPRPEITQNPRPETTHWKWADSLDAVSAAPKSHRVLFENDSVRILEVKLLPYMQEPMHVHRWPSYMFGNNNGDTSSFDIVYYRYAFDSINHRYFVKDSFPQHNGGSRDGSEEEGHAMKPEGPHSIKNLSNVTIDVYRIEFKK